LCYTPPMYTNENSHRIFTRSGKQRALWQRLFHMDTLPVTSAFPHEGADIYGRSAWHYTLDVARMNPRYMRRLANHVAKWSRDYAETLDRIQREGWQIDAIDCFLVEAAEGESLKPSFYLGRELLLDPI